MNGTRPGTDTPMLERLAAHYLPPASASEGCLGLPFSMTMVDLKIKRMSVLSTWSGTLYGTFCVVSSVTAEMVDPIASGTPPFELEDHHVTTIRAHGGRRDHDGGNGGRCCFPSRRRPHPGRLIAHRHHRHPRCPPRHRRQGHRTPRHHPNPAPRSQARNGFPRSSHGGS